MTQSIELNIPATAVERVEKVSRDPIMQFFSYAHLPADKQATSKPFGDLAEHIHATVPANEERRVALRKLLEAKDAAVRAGFSRP